MHAWIVARLGGKKCNRGWGLGKLGRVFVVCDVSRRAEAFSNVP